MRPGVLPPRSGVFQVEIARVGRFARGRDLRRTPGRAFCYSKIARPGDLLVSWFNSNFRPGYKRDLGFRLQHTFHTPQKQFPRLRADWSDKEFDSSTSLKTKTICLFNSPLGVSLLVFLCSIHFLWISLVNFHWIWVAKSFVEFWWRLQWILVINSRTFDYLCSCDFFVSFLCFFNSIV